MNSAYPIFEADRNSKFNWNSGNSFTVGVGVTLTSNLICRARDHSDFYWAATYVNSSGTTADEAIHVLGGSKFATPAGPTSTNGARVGDAAGVEVTVSNANVTAAGYRVYYSDPTAGAPPAGGDGSILRIF